MCYRIKSDKDLVVLLNSNDESAFRELYIRYKDRLWNYIFAFLKADDESDDLIQDIFIHLWELRHSVNPELSFSSFIYKMAKNKVLNYFRDKDLDFQYKKSLNVSKPIEIDSIDADIIYLEYQKILIAAIEQLPPQRKRIFNMSRIEHKTHKEIAIQLGISVSTVQEHISASLHFIKIYFTKNSDLILKFLILAFILI